jgi:YD repeat-containing protein
VEAPAGYNLYSTAFQEYDGFGNLKRTIDARGVVTTNTWDALGRLVKQTVLETNAVQLKSEGFAYEPGGLVIYATNALGGVTQTLYNSLGKPRFRRGPDGSTNAWTYYLDGRPRREYQGNGAYSETTYDDLNRRVTRIFYTATNSALATNSTVLDRRGNVVQRVDAAGSFHTLDQQSHLRCRRCRGPRRVDPRRTIRADGNCLEGRNRCPFPSQRGD